MTSPLPSAFEHVDAVHLPVRPAELVAISDLALSEPSRQFVLSEAPSGVFRHQHDVIGAGLAGSDVCVSTGTASGKSLAFQTLGIELLARDPQARILALYPMKALGREQEERWRRAIGAAGIRADVARIDGSVNRATRLDLIARARVIIATPDVVHAWLLPRAGQPDHARIRSYLRKLALVVLDEAHSYTGVFGSNAAFVLRRLQYAARLVGGRELRFVAASATLSDPAGHLERLTGRRFVVVGPERDTSPRHGLSIEFARPAASSDFLANLSDLLTTLRDAGERFIAFFDSRRSAEQMAGILQREEPDAGGFEHLLNGRVLPFRAGYEHEHRDVIQQRLSDGSLAGVVSTSALELGLDIPGLQTAVLVGVPATSTSLYQRIGRVGRSGPGRVIIVHAGGIGDDVAFASPRSLFDRPLNESTVYLDNQRIQYIHAMAVAREHDMLGDAGEPITAAGISWPDGFLRLAEDERHGAVPLQLRDMKRDAGDIAAITFPLRDVESQFDVLCGRGSDRQPLGSLSFGQVMREAYPGAIYHYTGRTYRVTHVDARAKQVFVTNAPRYSTRARPVVTRIAPQRAAHRMVRHGELVIADTDLQIRRSVMGFQERRGSQVESVVYPCTDPVLYSQPAFSRTLFTTGVVLAHPVLDRAGVELDVLGSVLLDALLLVVPTERQDVDVASDLLRGAWGPVNEGRRVIVLFDQTYGSLHLSARFQDTAALRRALEIVVATLASRDDAEVDPDTQVGTEATSEAAAALLRAMTDHEAIDDDSITVSGDLGGLSRVMLPRSKGVAAHRPRDAFEIHQIFVRVDLGVCYRGVWISPDGGRQPGVVATSELQPASSDVVWGFYDPETGDQQPASAAA